MYINNVNLWIICLFVLKIFNIIRAKYDIATYIVFTYIYTWGTFTGGGKIDSDYGNNK